MSKASHGELRRVRVKMPMHLISALYWYIAHASTIVNPLV